MPDSPLDKHFSGPYDPGMEQRVARLEDDMREMKASVVRLEASVHDVRQSTARIEAMFAATVPHLATKADLADKPTKIYLWGVLAVLLTSYASGLAALAILK
jgi:hypothetical protein